jgi:hypothetical protein
MSKFVVSILGILLLVCSLSVRAACTGSGPRPSWIASPDMITEEHYWSAGVSSESGGPLSSRIATARAAALKNLAETLQVNVRSSLELEQKRQQAGGAVLTESNLRSVTETSTNASLENVEAVETWEDPAGCLVWVRVRVAKKIVEQKQREGVGRQLFAVLTDKLGTAQDAAASMEARQAALEAALDALPRIPFDLIPEASSQAYYSQLLKRVGDALGSARGDIKQARTLLDQAEGFINNAAGQAAEAARVRSLLSAINIFRDLLYRYPTGLAPSFGPGDLYMKLGEVEEMRGNTCGAKGYYQQAVEAKQLVDRRAVARKRAETLNCSPAEMEKTVWRQFFEGRDVDIVCFHNTRGAPSAWPKACDEVGNVVRSLGAEANLSAVQLSAAQTQSMLKGEIPASLGKAGKPILGYVASGQMTTRQDGESGKQGREYRFEGMIWTLLLDNGQTIYSDRFQGTTGWNPISAEMVLDVLALNVVKRWRDKFSKFLRHEVDR